MAAPWRDRKQRERFVEFLKLEIEVLRSAAGGSADKELLARYEAFLKECFPRTRAFIESRLPEDPAGGFSDEIRVVAWAEARAAREGSTRAEVPGTWTKDEIARDINECFREALGRAVPGGEF